MDAPVEARVWLLKGGLNIERAAALGICYSPKMHRVILPVYEGSELVAVQARALEPWQQPKYLNLSDRFTRVLFWAGREHLPGPVTITEDILSALAVAKVGCAASVMGTALSAERASLVAAETRRVNLWLDPDSAGRRGMTKAERALELHGVATRRIRSERDPKYYSKEQVSTYLNGN